jgi:diaminopimelate decarboxylase
LATQTSPTSALPVEILPASARINATGHLEIGGVDTVELARRFGTPLYVFDEAEIRRRCRAVRAAFQREYPDALPIYASKAYLDPSVARIVAEEGLGLDVVSGGEIGVAQRAGFPLERAYFHGNNKQREELELALDAGVGHIVIDNFYEIELLEQVAAAKGRRARALLRVSPGVEAHTHDYLKTGILDTKFGFPLATGQAAEAVARTLAQPHIELVGLHAHIGTQIFETLPYAETVDLLMQFAGEMQRQHGFRLQQISPGGGWGINYTRTDTALPVEEWAQTVATAVRRGAEALGIPLPRLVIEPGRWIIGPAGVALYTVGATKEIPGVRTYVSVDGGMGDNIRPAIYGAKYEVIVCNKPVAVGTKTVTIVGKYCESGDFLVKDVTLPPLEPGDVVALPASGAYCIPMSSNYCLIPRPAIVFVRDGEARLVRRRETVDDMLKAYVL